MLMESGRQINNDNHHVNVEVMQVLLLHGSTALEEPWLPQRDAIIC
jgi:hypothetical protein